MARGDTLPCTPETAQAAIACLECGSWKQLWAALVLVLCKLNAGDPDADCSFETLRAECGCYSCMSDHQLFAAAIAALGQYTINQGYLEPGNLLQELECLTCAPPKDLRAIALCQLCTYLNALTNPQ